jgi:hypothetical protein
LIVRLRINGRTLCALAALCLLIVPTPASAQVSGETKPSPSADAPSNADADAFQKKASDAQARIRGNEDDANQLKRAVKINEVALAKEVLLRNGFTANDLENAKMSLRTGGGKGGEDTIEISVTCCNPKEITIQRTLANYTK